MRPSVLAVFRLITSSNLAGVDRQVAGLAPFRMRSTYPAPWRDVRRVSPISDQAAGFRKWVAVDRRDGVAGRESDNQVHD